MADTALTIQQTVKALFKRNETQVEELLPKHITAERIMRLTFNCIRTTPALLECTQGSMLGFMIESAQLGLEPGGHLGHSYPIPFRNKQRRCREVQMVVGYRGMLDLGYRSGKVAAIHANPVFEQDDFEYQLGTNPGIEHIPHRGPDRGDLVATYMALKLSTGESVFRVVERHEIEETMKFVKRKNGGRLPDPWQKHFIPMSVKTAVRRGYTYMPLSVEITRAAVIDDQADAWIPQDLGRNVMDFDQDHEQPLDERAADAAREADQAAEAAGAVGGQPIGNGTQGDGENATRASLADRVHQNAGRRQ